MPTSTRFTLLPLSALLIGIAYASAVSADAVDVVKTRQHDFKDLGAATKLVKDQLAGGSPDADKIKAAAATIKQAAAAIPNWFPAGSDASAGVKTAAKAEIWSDAAGFASARDSFVEQAGKFSVLANSGDVAAEAEGFKVLGKTCGGCHEKYRVKQD
jgi:cytochrome c556